MPTVLVQQFYETDDQFYELGGEQTIDLTDEELTQLQERDGEVVFLASRNGHFALIEQA
ncbi:hypothetical protein ACT2FY_00445 [Paraburkholderia fungorum]|uniref:hypothetical protein n=1 Tax=Paraburkholderia fungorum TaxID=134537 RepID=UPI00402B4CA9